MPPYSPLPSLNCICFCFFCCVLVYVFYYLQLLYFALISNSKSREYKLKKKMSNVKYIKTFRATETNVPTSDIFLFQVAVVFLACVVVTSSKSVYTLSSFYRHDKECSTNLVSINPDLCTNSSGRRQCPLKWGGTTSSLSTRKYRRQRNN